MEGKKSLTEALKVFKEGISNDEFEKTQEEIKKKEKKEIQDLQK